MEELVEHLLSCEDRIHFITGAAGTGKSYLIKLLREKNAELERPNDIEVLSPTASAALNVDGRTVHSFFKLPHITFHKDGTWLEDYLSRYGGRLDFSDIDILIIDEASMIRADLCMAVDKVLREFGGDSEQFMGGVKVLFVGDLFQLPPVVSFGKNQKDAEKAFFADGWSDQAYFFDHLENEGLIPDVNFHELEKIYRQDERNMIKCLSAIRNPVAAYRNGHVTNSKGFSNSKMVEIACDYLSSNCVGFSNSGDALSVCLTNRQVRKINEDSLRELEGDLFEYRRKEIGEVRNGKEADVVPSKLELKKGARVVFIKNHPSGVWVNGTQGVVNDLTEEVVTVRIFDNDQVVEVRHAKWDLYNYRMKDGKQEAFVEGQVTQFPLTLFFAATAHKMQGNTVSTPMNVDLSGRIFATGQLYSILSRASKMNFLNFSRKLSPNDVKISKRAAIFEENLISNGCKVKLEELQKV